MAAGGSEESLGSQYVLVDQIGAGATGTVWRARHRETGEIVAAKLLREGLAGDRDLVLRFVQERNVMRTLRHPNIVTMRDFVIEGERLALVMDFVEGGDLRGLVQRRGTLPPAAAARLMAQVSGALATAHTVGVVHRDVKPANILIDEASGHVRLTDFGVARIVHGPSLTQTSSIIGTPTYLAPEVADGSPPTPAVDVYAIGLILYELLAGRPPFIGDHPMALLRQHATAMPRRLPAMPDALWSIIWACTAKEPAARPAAAAVAAALSEAAPSLAALPALPPISRAAAPAATSEPGVRTAPSSHGPPTRPPRIEEPPRPGRSRRRLVAAAATATALALTATVLAVVAPWRARDAGAVGPPATTITSPAPAATTSSPARSTPSAKIRAVRSHTPKTPTAEPPTTKPATTKPATQRPRKSPPVTAKPEQTKTPTPEPVPQNSGPKWQCRSWLPVATGAEMSPCVALVGGSFHLMGRIRGSASVRSDIHVQLYNTDAELTLSAPFICEDKSPAADGGIVTCGPYVATTARTGSKVDVRQRWRAAGTATFGGGAESPWFAW
ncbi:serine/threonine-protein kinase [Nonomuraea sp. LPB2021202275-12-8]|uniref:serine/threonine-protein kinase n=1 Tax=Nonomuraea sp. LPB2021202275-12-8 TaxID=3120159 RepID=UPI00300C0CA6